MPSNHFPAVKVVFGWVIAVNFQPIEQAAMQSLRELCRALAADGHLELFNMSAKYGGRIGREQHHFPTLEQLPL